ncbi:polyhydroxyalkanoate synthesis repressor PhaR [Pedomonas mirosovicensis]|uniref:polyhydroxyalkanoate synthesis repressor PhaR n=1 Tax=Pedomonas mirosovicensis TaxID=2908641 RepID=UPI0021695BEA|nr:polyhydroxyalkanoate synthesis repressor PhaR [Pedomonas mirosovicensis]MCH8684977.1 polyhydroxyalkanoate synthesis repressor PhaR [Pedomonas mirosovicensis]
MVETGPKTPPIIIKKYANRRLYNTETSSYITLEHLAQMVRDNREFKVVDAKTGDDITRTVLTQIIVEEEAQGKNMLPISFLRQLISMYGDSMQALMPQYLEASMEAFRRNHEQFRKALEGAFSTGAFGPFEQIAKQNMAMFEAAAGMFGGKPQGEAGHAPQQTEPEKTPEKPKETAKSADELAELKAQMAELQNRLDRLSSK